MPDSTTHLSSYETVLDLLEKVPLPPEGEKRQGASAEEMETLAATLGYFLPRELETWLMHVNGTLAGPGGIYGTGSCREFLDLQVVLELHPYWKARKWIPVAGDGMGNHYVLDASGTKAQPVYFIDTHEDPEQLAYAVASSLPLFLVQLLRDELGQTGWPFQAQHVLGFDPTLEEVVPKRLLPWRKGRPQGANAQSFTAPVHTEERCSSHTERSTADASTDR